MKKVTDFWFMNRRELGIVVATLGAVFYSYRMVRSIKELKTAVEERS